MTTTLEIISEKITNAKQFADVFGVMHSKKKEERLHELRKQYVYMAKSTHPDHVLKTEEAQANRVFQQIVTLYESAKEAIEHGTYEKTFVQGAYSRHTPESDFTFSSDTNMYSLRTSIWAEGDFSNIHLGTTSTGKRVYAKVAFDPTMNQYLAHEATVYSALKKHTVEKKLWQFIPELLDTVLIELTGNKRIRANVFEFQEGYVSLTKIREVYPHGLDPRDAAWIWRRVLGQVLTAELFGVVHGAIVPDHVLVHPETHNPLHIGWSHSVLPTSGTFPHIDTCIDRWKEWYPCEVAERKDPTHKTDLYMAGVTMKYLLGCAHKDSYFPSAVPSEIQHIVNKCIEDDPRRRPTALEVLEQFTDTVHRLWGRTYRKLSMPQKA